MNQRLLIVDDDRAILRDNENFFQSMGYDVYCAETAEAAEHSTATTSQPPSDIVPMAASESVFRLAPEVESGAVF